MSNIGYREIFDFGKLSVKQLNDNLRALWSKVMGDIGYRDLSDGARAVIDSKLTSDDLTGYSTTEQTSEAIRLEAARLDAGVARLTLMADQITAEVSELNGGMARLELMADQVAAEVTDLYGGMARLELMADQVTVEVADLNGDISQIRQSASELTSTVSSLSGAVSQVTQTADGLSSTVIGLNGRVSALEQTDRGVAVKIYDPSIDNTFTARVGVSDNYRIPGLEFDRDGFYSGGVYPARDILVLTSNMRPQSHVSVEGGDGSIDVGYDIRREGTAVTAYGHILPYTNDACDLGGNGASMRWNRIYANAAVNTSDLRLKTDVAPLNAADLLMRLEPIRYRMAGDPGGKLRFGLGAQQVAEALSGTDYERALLLDDENPACLGLCYQELIAVLVEGHQRQQRRIDELALRVAGLEQSRQT